MIQKNIKLYFLLLSLIYIICIAWNSGDAAVKKQKPPQKTEKLNARPVSAKRVLKDFTDEYKSPADSKILKKQYLGRVRNYREIRGEKQVPAQSHQVFLTVQLTDCGIQIRDTWEVYYYKLETEWIFQDIMQMQSTQLTKPKKKLPPLADAELKKLISDYLVSAQPNLEILEITILNKTGLWKLCTPMYRTTTKITLNVKNDLHNASTKYECVFVSTLARPENTWEHAKSSCVYRGKEYKDCHIGTFCLAITTESTIPALTGQEGLKLLQDRFQNQYTLRKNNIEVEEFILVKKYTQESYNTKIQYVIHAQFVIDEIKDELINENGSRKKGYRKVRAVYDCSVYAYLQYNLLDKKWEAFIESCCPTENEQCSWTCSSPGKGCKRLGEK